jgi:hypothetical protein
MAPYAEGLAFAPYDNLVERCLVLLADKGERDLIAEKGFEIMSGISQSAILREAIGR